jgi:hypothetical protein
MIRQRVLKMPPAPSKSFSLYVVDLPGTYQFLGSVAMAVAIQTHTKLQWKEYNENKVINGVYRVMAWKGKPGWVEIDQDWEKIKSTRAQLWERYTNAFMSKAATGAAEAVAYLKGMEKVKASASEGVQMLFRDAQNINSEVIGETTKAIHRLAAVKAGATISIALMSGGLAVVGSSLAVQAGGVALGYKIVGHAVKSLEEAETAAGVAVDFGMATVGEVSEEKGVQPFLEYIVRFYSSSPAALEAAKRLGLHQKTVGAIEEYSRQLAKAKAESLKRKLQGRIAERGAQMQARQWQYAGYAARAIPVIFAVKDIVDAVDEYQEDTGQ